MKTVYKTKEEAQNNCKSGYEVLAVNTLALYHSVLFEEEYTEGWIISKSPKIKKNK
jgi:hypothetical protein